MGRNDTQMPEHHAPQAARAAALVLCGGLFLWVCALAAGPWDDGRAPFPYAWRDVAVVYLICALPLAALGIGVGRRRPAAAVVWGALVLAAGAVVLLPLARAELVGLVTAFPLSGSAVRAAPALGLALGGALLAGVLLRGRGTTGGRRTGAAAVAGLGVAALLLVPWVYAAARCRHDLARLEDLLRHSRVGEAHALATGLLVLDPGQTFGGRPLSELAAGLAREVAALESRVAIPLPAGAHPRARFDRARDMAMLGRTDAALEVLDPVRDAASAPNVENLRGTIHEARQEWDAALRSYRAAAAAWRALPESPSRTAGLVRAVKGTAYAERMSGRYAEAQTSYAQLLSLAPTAETHYLLAKFYEQTQQAEKARQHARAAIALAPERYTQSGERLIRNLSVSQFGCLGVFSAEQDHSSRPAP